MKKETFPIPAGCRAITMEIVDNKIVTTFEPQFKRGDVLIMKKRNVICVFNEFKGEDSFTEIVGLLEDGRLTFFNENEFDLVSVFRHATPDEAQPLWDALTKDGKRWNPEKMKIEEIEKIRWRAKQGEYYWMIQSDLTVKKTNDTYGVFDTLQYYSGMYFKTEEQALRVADRLQKSLVDFWKEELNKL